MSNPQGVSTGEGIDIVIQGTRSDAEALARADKVEEESVDDLPKESSSDEESTDRVDERQKRFQRLAMCVPLYQATLKGDWQEAKDVLDKYPHALQVPMTEENETALHIAATTKWTAFVKELVKRTNENDLKYINNYGQTALYFAAASGIVTIAEEMVNKSNELTLIRSNRGQTPLYEAALLGRREMVSYLFSVTPFESLSPGERIQLFVTTISNDLYDTAIKILERDPSLATAKDGHGITPMLELARKPFAIGSKNQLSVWEQCLNSWFKGICDKALMKTLAYELFECLWKQIRLLPDNQFSEHVNKLLFDAAEVGNDKLLVVLIRSYPDLIWKTDNQRRSIFHIAVVHRQKTVFSLIYEIGAIKDMLLTYVNDVDQNILHLAGYLAPESRLDMVSGEAFQMQLEMLWFKEVESILSPSYLNMKDICGRTPRHLFTESHCELQAKGAKWMKETVNFYIVVATLISAVVFAAVVTVPGGSNQETGTPILLKSIWFRVFFISNAIAMLSSSASILMYLSILTSRFTENDFLVSLPLKWVLGTITLVISIVGMVVAFSATCFLVFKSEMIWLPIVIIALAGVLLISFVSKHCQLWFGIIQSTNSSIKFLFRLRKNRLF